MPVRVIKQIKLGGNDLIVKVPKAIVRGIHLEQNDMFRCEFILIVIKDLLRKSTSI